MTKITLDSALRNRLLNLAQPLELCDDGGHVLARVTPVEDLGENAPFEPNFTEEELQRAEAESEEFTTAEVLQYLENIKCTESNGSEPH